MSKSHPTRLVQGPCSGSSPVSVSGRSFTGPFIGSTGRQKLITEKPDGCRPCERGAKECMIGHADVAECVYRVTKTFHWREFVFI